MYSMRPPPVDYTSSTNGAGKNRQAAPVGTLPDRDGRPQGPRLHLLADRQHLPAEPGRDGRLQRSEVRRRLLDVARGGPAAQARVRGGADRDRGGGGRGRALL